MAEVPRTEYIIADSTASSSSPCRPTADSAPDRDASTLVELPVQVKRVSRTYGRPKVDINTVGVTGDDPGSRARILKTAPCHADEQVIPESDDVDDRVPSFDGFDWRAKLKEIDEDYDNSGEIDTTCRSTNAFAIARGDASNVSQNVQESAHIFTASPLSSLSHLSLVGSDQHAADITHPTAIGEDSLFSGSQCTLLSSDQPSGSSFFSGSRGLLSSGEPEESGPITKSSRLLHKRVPMSPRESDSENTSPKHPYAINSPVNRSSPTPPTSPFAEELIPNEATVSGEESVHDGSKLDQTGRPSKKDEKKGKGSRNRKRIKLPTKKDVLESQKESARLLADQHVSIPRTEVQPVHTIANLFNKLKNAPTTLARKESDPITSFSSPGHPLMAHDDRTSFEDHSPVKPDHSVAAGSSSKPKETMFHSSRVRSSFRAAENPALDNADEDMPDPNEVLRDNDEQRCRVARERLERAEAARRARELQDHKRKALELSKTQYDSKATSSRADARARGDFDSDDDLEIVEDMISVPSRGHVVNDVKPFVHKPHATFGGIRAERQNASRSKTVSQKSLEFAARPAFVAAQDKRTSKRKAGHSTSVSHKDLNDLMLQRADKQSSVIEEQKKENWVRAGGTLKEQHIGNTAEKSVIDWLHRGATRENAMEMDEECDDEDAEDPEYTPEGTKDPRTDKSDNEASESRAPDTDIPPERQMDISDDEQSEDTDKENHRPTIRRQSVHIIVDSDEEDDVALRTAPSRPKPVVLASDTSSAEDVVESPGEDKENSAELAFDLSEDKENARVPRHLPRGRVLNNDASPSPGFQDGDDVRADREPLSSLDVEGRSSFVPPLVQRRDPSQGRVLQVLHEEEIYFTLSPDISTKKRIFPWRTSSFSSPGSIDGHVESQDHFLGGGFSQFFTGNNDGADCEESDPRPAIGAGSFSQFFSPDDSTRESPLDKKDGNSFVNRPEPAARDDFQFTQQNTLLPSVRISESQRREVDEMFSKDQEFKLDEVKRSREEVKSSETSATGVLDFTSFAPSQPTQLSPRSARRPLETLPLDSGDSVTRLYASPESVHSTRRRLLRERPRKLQESPSPSPARRNAFDELRDAAAKGKRRERAPKPRLEQSDFVEAEAQESDEEAMIGFGGAREDGDDEEDDQNAIVEGLVDDTVMDAKAQAADLVLEKHMEHQAADDAALEKLHQDAVAGKLRGKRRDRGLGFEDSDSDEEYKGPRKPLNKKRRIEGDTLESYGQNPETKAFYDAYQAELAEDPDPRLAHLQQTNFDPMQEQDSDSSEEGPDTIDSAEVRRRLKELPKREIPLETAQDLHDLSWMEDDDGITDDFRVEERPFRTKKSASEFRPSFHHLDYRGIAKGKKTDTAEQVQLKSWASQEAKMHSSASGRGGFSRKEEGVTGGSRKRHKIATASKMSVAGEDHRAAAKSSSLMSRMEKHKGFDN